MKSICLNKQEEWVLGEPEIKKVWSMGQNNLAACCRTKETVGSTYKICILDLLLQSPLGGSWIWNGIWECLNIILNGACWSVTCPSNTHIWDDPWIPSIENLQTSSSPSIRRGTNVCKRAQKTKTWAARIKLP